MAESCALAPRRYECVNMYYLQVKIYIYIYVCVCVCIDHAELKNVANDNNKDSKRVILLNIFIKQILSDQIGIKG